MPLSFHYSDLKWHNHHHRAKLDQHCENQNNFKMENSKTLTTFGIQKTAKISNTDRTRETYAMSWDPITQLNLGIICMSVPIYMKCLVLLYIQFFQVIDAPLFNWHW
jgi:hypothetical protein